MREAVVENLCVVFEYNFHSCIKKPSSSALCLSFNLVVGSADAEIISKSPLMKNQSHHRLCLLTSRSDIALHASSTGRISVVLICLSGAFNVIFSHNLPPTNGVTCAMNGEMTFTSNLMHCVSPKVCLSWLTVCYK